MKAELKSIRAPDLATIDAAVPAVLVRAKVPMLLLDARTCQYDDGRRIPGARNPGVKSTASEVKEGGGDSDSLIITYCSDLHCPASMALYRHLKNLAYENVLDYPDGIAGRQAAGYPVEQAARTA